MAAPLIASIVALSFVYVFYTSSILVLYWLYIFLHQFYTPQGIGGKNPQGVGFPTPQPQSFAHKCRIAGIRKAKLPPSSPELAAG